MGTYRRNPDRLDNQMAKVIKGVTGWTYLPLAGASAITDVGSIAMAHGFKDTFKAGAAEILQRGYAGNVIKEAQIAGELLDITRNVAGREIVSDSMKRIEPKGAEKFVSIGNKVFTQPIYLHLLPLLAKRLIR